MKSLSFGARGPQVELLQAVLKRAGYSELRIDGIFGSATEAAVKNFQNRQNIKTDGVVGPETWRELNPYLVGYETITVQPGDTYWLVAQRFGTSVSAVSAANPEYDPMNLPIGAKLVVPLPPLGVGQGLVGLVDVLELGGRRRIVGVEVRVVLFGQLPVGLFDFVLGSAFL